MCFPSCLSPIADSSVQQGRLDGLCSKKKKKKKKSLVVNVFSLSFSGWSSCGGRGVSGAPLVGKSGARDERGGSGLVLKAELGRRAGVLGGGRGQGPLDPPGPCLAGEARCF